MVVLGLLTSVLRGDFFSGFWILMVGVFLCDSATGIIRDVRRLEHTPVESVMHLPISDTSGITIQEFVDSVLPMYRNSKFPVVKDNQLLGVLMLEEMRAIDNVKWRSTKIDEVMRPIDRTYFVEVGTSLAEAREMARSNGIGSIYVIGRNGRLVGVVRSVSTR